ncbi:MAG: UDP-N-acetylmuramate dehydrogenase [Bacilli bacterium]|nr:UDP-N-acetylmuramate dehydrogenase [Bacilli bacterium]
MKVVTNAPIKDYTTYKLTGTIKKVVYPENIYELIDLLNELKGQKYKVIGNGSNLIFLENYNGVIIKLNNLNKLEIKDNVITVEAGYNLMKLALKTAKLGLSGLEFASGIPATIGGAICMNAGAYNKEMKDVVREVIIIDGNLNIKKISGKKLKFSYRNSIFKEKNYICLKATLVLEKKNKEEILELIKKRKQRRLKTQPLDKPSAGSVFTNPENDYAGRLIEEAGLKGKQIGAAVVSEKHANFIINDGSASGKDVKDLIIFIQKEIRNKYGIDLKTEQEIVK